MNGFFAEALPGLKHSIGVGGMEIPVLKLLQHGSSLLGASALGWFAVKLPVHKAIAVHPDGKHWAGFALLTLAIVVVRLKTGLDPRQCGHLIVTMLSASLIALLLTSIVAGIRKGA